MTSTRLTMAASLRRTVLAAARSNGSGGTCSSGGGGCCSSLRLGAARGGACSSDGCGCGSSSVRRAFSTTPAARQATTTLPIRVQGTGTGTVQALSVPGKPYTFSSDTYTTLGGTDGAPSPVVYSLASLAACNQVTGAVVARDHGVRLGRWTVDVEGALPTAVLVQGAEGNPNWESVALSVRVQTDARDDAAFQHFVGEVERRCPITALFKRSGVVLTSTWVNEAL